mmetsp:Transcript_14219/g.30548  ORF Transcript_14219/g.30548 Transcript_14219/m.30548 type:complete len:101 (-) Transcript_14219:1079-1381(-)
MGPKQEPPLPIPTAAALDTAKHSSCNYFVRKARQCVDLGVNDVCKPIRDARNLVETDVSGARINGILMHRRESIVRATEEQPPRGICYHRSVKRSNFRAG